MSSEMYSVVGEASWAQVFEFNMDREYEQTSITVTLDQEELNKFAKTGSRTTPKVTEEGVTVKFRRKFEHPSIPALGGVPKVVDKDDNLWDTENLIGNGYKVEVYFLVYDTKFGKGMRLEGVRVLDLVEYEGDGPNAGLPF